jgi:bZIP factor
MQNLLRNMKYEYSFHQQQLLSAAAVMQQRQQEPIESALDLTKRRDSVESDTRKTTSPSSFEQSPNAHSPTSLVHRHMNMNMTSKMSSSVTPEHSIQYHPYATYEHNSPSTATSQMMKTLLHSPHQMPVVRKLENKSPSSSNHMYESFNSVEKSITLQVPTHDCEEEENSNDLPSASNISSSSSIASSSQKSPTSSSTSLNASMMVVGRDGKLSRPFKAYPRDPLSLSAGALLDGSSAEKYAVFRKRMLEQIHAANGGAAVVNNPKMRRVSTKINEVAVPETNNNEPIFVNNTDKSMQKLGHDKDDAYYERRKKNNAAAKKSRDRRRIKEDEIAIRAAFLERENIELKFELAAARKQLSLYGVTGIAGITS